MHAADPILSADGLLKSYPQGSDPLPALRDVSLAIDPGELVVITGPSGSGKSTLLHILGGLDRPDHGDVFLGGRSLTRMSDDELTLLRRRSIGFVFQFFHLLPMLTAEENVALPLLLDGAPIAAARPRVLELLDTVGLAHRARHRPDELSGGEMQRVAIARALVMAPLVLLADEPTGNLDSENGRIVIDLIRSTAATYGQTVVLVTHDPRLAAEGTRVVSLRDGRIESDVHRA